MQCAQRTGDGSGSGRARPGFFDFRQANLGHVPGGCCNVPYASIPVVFFFFSFLFPRLSHGLVLFLLMFKVEGKMGFSFSLKVQCILGIEE